MRSLVKLVAMAGVFSLGVFGIGCKRQVPDDIIQKAMERSLRAAPATASAMCGGQTRGFTSVKIVSKTKKADNTGSAHIKGRPWMSTTGAKLPTECEGDIDYAFTYTTKKIGRRTNTTWYLDKMALTAVQTPGVTFKPASDTPVDDDDDDPKTVGPGASQ